MRVRLGGLVQLVVGGQLGLESFEELYGLSVEGGGVLSVPAAIRVLKPLLQNKIADGPKLTQLVKLAGQRGRSGGGGE